MIARRSLRRRAAASLALMLVLSACQPGTKASHPQPVSARAPVSVDTVVELLDQGDELHARKQLKVLFRRNPADPALRVLQESLDQDPVQLLGPKSFPYTVQRGETVIELAERFLGNRLKFYQLARYNGVKVPGTLAPGVVLRIPGEAPRPVPPPHPVPLRPAPPATPEAASKPTAPTPAPRPAPAVNPAMARQLRGLGLAALNQGKVDRAVALLRRAAALDPGNPLIARDLARAGRIAATVQAKH